MVATTTAPSFAAPKAIVPAMPKWDPRAVVAIENPSRYGPTCVGRAVSTGNRCGWSSSSIDPDRAEDLLDTIALQAPDAVALEGLLLQVARAMLCHFHPNQARSVVAKWQAAIAILAKSYVAPAEPVRLPLASADDFAAMALRLKTDSAAKAAEAKALEADRKAKLAQQKADKLAADLVAERAAAELAKRAATAEAVRLAVEETKRVTMEEAKLVFAEETKRVAAQIAEAKQLQQALEAQRDTLRAERNTLAKERSTHDSSRRALEETRGALQAERSTLEKDRSLLEEERSMLGEDRSTLESSQASVFATVQAAKQWTEKVDEWKSEAKSQQSFKLSLRTLRRRPVVPAAVLDIVPTPPAVVRELRTDALESSTRSSTGGEAFVLPSMPDVPTAEPGRRTFVRAQDEPAQPAGRKLRDLPHRRVKEMAS